MVDIMGNSTGVDDQETPAAAAPDNSTSEKRFLNALNMTAGEQARYGDSTSMWRNFTSAIGLGDPVENPYKVVSEIISTRTPDQLLTALETANPEYKGAFDAVRGDDAFKTSLHEAFSKDPTVLEGIGTMLGKDSAMTPKLMTEALQDPANRKIFGDMLHVVAESPDLKFSDLSSAMESGVALSGDKMNADKQKKWKESLSRFGLQDERMALAEGLNDPMKMLDMLFKDPQGVAKMLFDAFKDSIPPEYHNMAMGGINQLIGGLSAFADPNGDWVGHYVTAGKMVGQTIGNSWEKDGQAILNPVTIQAGLDAGQGEKVDPTKDTANSKEAFEKARLYIPEDKSIAEAHSVADADLATRTWKRDNAPGFNLGQ